MTMAPRVARHLADQSIAHRVLSHAQTPTAARAGQATHISGNRIAKAVALRDGDGFVLAVLPASHHVSLELLQAWLGRPFSLASERDASDLFPDCDLGAIPPIGQVYGVDVLVDESLFGLDQVCFEGGDHQSLVQVGGEDFAGLMSGAQRGRFSTHD
ncbi:MAG: aminoacyl-tRNA deacylase [Geminicoccaceae bacterium]